MENRLLRGCEYKNQLCRFPRESGLAHKPNFPAQEKIVEWIRTKMPASVKDDFEKLFICADVTNQPKLKKDQRSVFYR